MKNINIKKWTARFIKFSILGGPCFLISTIIYYELFLYIDGTWAYLVSCFSAGVAHFAIVGVFNKTEKGEMFETSTTHQG